MNLKHDDTNEHLGNFIVTIFIVTSFDLPNISLFPFGSAIEPDISFGDHETRLRWATY